MLVDSSLRLSVQKFVENGRMDGEYVVDSVTSETAPWVHAANLEQAQFVRQTLRVADVLIVDLDGSKMLTLDQLFAEYKQNFSFPDYFGGNWSAFDECLKDLEWLPARRYLTIISNAELVLSREGAACTEFRGWLPRQRESCSYPIWAWTRGDGRVV
ncbi:barstar family protein [Arthrobacter sp. R3-55]